MNYSLIFASLMLLTVNYGCVQKGQEEVRIEIKNLQAAGGKSLYSIVGTTNLPESSRITVEAVRYLNPKETQSEVLPNSNPDTKRSILARQLVEVKQGKWQADLNLWQVAPDGSFQEAWQGNKAQIGLIPESGVTFIAIFDPASQWQQSDHQQSEKRNLENQQLEGKLVRFTNEGEKYVQASQTLLIPLPNGKTTPPRPQPGDLNGGWGNRYQIPPTPVATKATFITFPRSRQTNASLKRSEFLR